MFGSLIAFPQSPIDSLKTVEIEVVDEADYLTSREEKALESALEEFGKTTGITTKIVLVEPEEWLDNGSLQNYAYNRYYYEFDNEDSWLLIYSHENNGYGEWWWESVDGDNVIPITDVYFDEFQIALQSDMTVSDAPDIDGAFIKALTKAMDEFNHQTIGLNWEIVPMLLFMVPFIGFHSYVMIFAGTRKKYSNKELEEIVDTTTESTSNQNSSQSPMQNSPSEQTLSRGREFECIFCGFKYYEAKNNCCPNCGAIITEQGE